MSHLERRGFTLAELLIGLVLLGIVSTAIYRVLISNQRMFTAQTARMDVQQNIRAAAGILPAEFRELDATDSDIVAMSATSITVRAPRWVAVLCNPPILGAGLTGLLIGVRSPYVSGARTINTATDSLFIWYEGDGSKRGDDGWVIAAPTAAVSANCPDGKPGQTITIKIMGFNAGTTPPQVNKAGAITNGSPVRGFQDVTYGVYVPSGDSLYYLGYTAGGVTTPVIGPLNGASGVTFTYLDSLGVVTANQYKVAQIVITLRERTPTAVFNPNGALAPRVDSVTTVVALRNNRRF